MVDRKQASRVWARQNRVRCNVAALQARKKSKFIIDYLKKKHNAHTLDRLIEYIKKGLI